MGLTPDDHTVSALSIHFANSFHVKLREGLFKNILLIGKMLFSLRSCLPQPHRDAKAGKTKSVQCKPVALQLKQLDGNCPKSSEVATKIFNRDAHADTAGKRDTGLKIV